MWVSKDMARVECSGGPCPFAVRERGERGRGRGREGEGGGGRGRGREREGEREGVVTCTIPFEV